MNTKVILERRIGTRTLAGTEWPVTHTLTRYQVGGSRPVWVIAKFLCNGLAESNTTYRRRREALEAWGPVKDDHRVESRPGVP